MATVDARGSKRYWEKNQNDKTTLHTLAAVTVLKLSYYYPKKPMETYWWLDIYSIKVMPYIAWGFCLVWFLFGCCLFGVFLFCLFFFVNFGFRKGTGTWIGSFFSCSFTFYNYQWSSLSHHSPQSIQHPIWKFQFHSPDFTWKKPQPWSLLFTL